MPPRPAPPTRYRPYKNPRRSERCSAGLVGPAGFEPTDGGVKVLCLTAWRRPSKRKDRVAVPARSLVGCLEGFEPSASRATIWRANQLRHRHHTVRPKGLEPPAHCLEGSCSLQLSYGRIMVLARWGMLRRILYQMHSGKSRGAAAFFGFFSLWAAPGPQSTARTTKESCTPPKFGSCPACGRRGAPPAVRTARRCQKSALLPGW